MQEIVTNWAQVSAYLAAGFCMGIGALGPSLGQGLIAARACENIAKNPESAKLISNTMILGMAFTESCAIYALVISLFLLAK